MVKVFAFDLDGTLTQHKTPLDDKNRAILEKLAERYTLLIGKLYGLWLQTLVLSRLWSTGWKLLNCL